MIQHFLSLLLSMRSWDEFHGRAVISRFSVRKLLVTTQNLEVINSHRDIHDYKESQFLKFKSIRINGNHGTKTFHRI